jgi:PTH1 family peptidyl-tRNA hydrolase
MKLIVGLGNPGRQYEHTRHNAGFEVIDELARRWSIDVHRSRFSALSGDGRIGAERVTLLKPQTYMNLSGRSVREAATFHKIALIDVLIVLDDLALPLGKIRLRAGGSAGGHNGLTSVIAEMGGEDMARLRIGIEWVSGAKAVGHVLGKFTVEERKLMDQAAARAADAVECWTAEGVQAAMNRFNRANDVKGEQT